MIKFIRKLLGLCDHKWETVEKGRLHNADDDSKQIIGDYFILQCTKCGNVKVKNLV